MGLSIAVGVLAAFKVYEPESLEESQDIYDVVSALAVENGYQKVEEPDGIEPWDAQLIGYSGLHYLRRIAAHLDAGKGLAEPGNDNSASDEVLEAYFKDAGGSITTGLLSRFFAKTFEFKREFDHLILHSDCEGFYIPQKFRDVIYSTADIAVAGHMVGSSSKLLEECERLAEALHIPSHINKDSEAIWDAVENQGEGDELWQKYGMESFACVVLRDAAKYSVESGAPIVFC